MTTLKQWKKMFSTLLENFSYGLAHDMYIFHVLCRKTYGKRTSVDQKKQSMNIHQELLKDVTWRMVMTWEPKSRLGIGFTWKRSEESRPKKWRKVQWNVNVYFDYSGVVHRVFLSEDRIGKMKYYLVFILSAWNNRKFFGDWENTIL